MPRSPRLSDTDKADIAARHEVVTGRIMAGEDIARKVIREPIDDATKQLVFNLAGEVEAASVKRTMFSSVRAISSALSDGAQHAVALARDHARALATGQAASDLAAFAKRAAQHGLNPAMGHGHALPHGRPPTASAATREQDGAIAHQAGYSLAHKWSSEALGNYVQWKREGGGVDGLVRRLQGIGKRGGLETLIETQAITQSVDAYADQHALTWSNITQQIAGAGQAIEVVRGDASVTRWTEGLYDVWSAMLDRKTCSVCSGLDGEMVRSGREWPDGRPPNHPRCRCCQVAVFIPEAALKAMPGVQLDYKALKQDVQSYMKGSTISLGEGKRHAQEFVRDALASYSSIALAGRVADRRSYFPGLIQARAPRLLF